jgi:ribosomal protein S18 acetylase RimI-like enzyme
MIRLAKIEDSSRMAEINVFGWRCAYKHFISLEYLFNDLSIKNKEKRFIEILSIKNNPGKTYVFEEKNIVKAFMIIGNCNDEDKNEKTFELWAVYVDPLFQRQNIGKQLLDFCVNEAIKAKKEEITVWVFEKNDESIKFYEKMGYKKKKKIKIDEKHKENEIRMIKKL